MTNLDPRAPQPMTVLATYVPADNTMEYKADGFPGLVEVDKFLALGGADPRLLGTSVMQGKRYLRFAFTNGIALYEVLDETPRSYFARIVSLNTAVLPHVGVLSVAVRPVPPMMPDRVLPYRTA